MTKAAMRTPRPAVGLLALALVAFTGSAGAQPGVAAEIQALKKRLEALEAQQKAEAAKPAAARPGTGSIADTQFSWGGYVKADTLYSRFSEGEVAQGGARDFYLPGAIPVSSGGGDSRDYLDFHAKSSRLFFSTKTPVGGKTVGTHMEFDFIVNQSASANELVTNAYTPGFRRAFITYGNWLAGQEWSTFQNLGAIPEALDFVEFPSEGTVFVRQPMLRYTSGGFMAALENPESLVGALNNGVYGTRATNDATAPDLVLRYGTTFAGGSQVTLAGLVRQIKVEDPGGADDSTTGFGASLSGKFVFGSDDLRFMFTGGSGLGRYVALAAAADAVLDANGELEEIDVLAGYLAYKRAWTPRWRSNLILSAFSADNDTALTGTGVTERMQSVAINLLYSPVPRLTVGGEFRHGERELESGADGSLDRFQFSVRYNLY